jgi:hypothetical protein
VAVISLSGHGMQRWWWLELPGPGWKWEPEAELVFFGTSWYLVNFSVKNEVRS